MTYVSRETFLEQIFEKRKCESDSI